MKLSEVARNYYKLGLDIKDLKEEREKLRDKLIQYMQLKEINEKNINGLKIIYQIKQLRSPNTVKVLADFTPAQIVSMSKLSVTEMEKVLGKKKIAPYVETKNSDSLTIKRR